MLRHFFVAKIVLLRVHTAPQAKGWSFSGWPLSTAPLLAARALSPCSSYCQPPSALLASTLQHHTNILHTNLLAAGRT